MRKRVSRENFISSPFQARDKSCHFFIWAHRGASSDAPENTLAAFCQAEEQGADGLELDVHLSRDGVPVVIHDKRIDRTTNGHGPVESLALRDLRRFDAGGWFASEYSGEKIPTLAEVLDWAGGRLHLNLEIKTLAAGRAVINLLRDFPQCRILISSFDQRLLADLRGSDSHLPLGFLWEGWSWHSALSRAAQNGASSFHPRRDRVNRIMMNACRSARLPVFPWTVDDPVEAGRLLQLGCAGFFTNRPQDLREALTGKGF